MNILYLPGIRKPFSLKFGHGFASSTPFLLAILVIGLICFAVPVNVSAQSTTSCIRLNNANLKIGATDATTAGEVTLLQKYLQQKGYLAVAPTGYFGNQTVAAVKKFQIANGMPAVGVAGPMTRATIAGQSCSSQTSAPSNQSTNQFAGQSIGQSATQSANQQPQLPTGCTAGAIFNTLTGARCNTQTQPQAQVQTPTQTNSVISLDLQLGSKGTAVVELQTFLEKQGYLVMRPGVMKGEFDADTKAALIKYQTARGIVPASGIAGALTRGMIAQEGGLYSATQASAAASAQSSALKGDLVVTGASAFIFGGETSAPNRAGTYYITIKNIGKVPVCIPEGTKFRLYKNTVDAAGLLPQGEIIDGGYCLASSFDKELKRDLMIDRALALKMTGNFTLLAIADADNGVVEENESNNTFSRSESGPTSIDLHYNTAIVDNPHLNSADPYSWMPYSKADLVITDMYWDAASQTQGATGPFSFSYTVKNIGTEALMVNSRPIFLIRPDDSHPIPTPGAWNGVGISGGSVPFFLYPNESKTISDASMSGAEITLGTASGNQTLSPLRSKAGPLYVRLDYFPDAGTAESNRYNNFVDKTIQILPAVTSN